MDKRNEAYVRLQVLLVDALPNGDDVVYAIEEMVRVMVNDALTTYAEEIERAKE